MSDRKPKVKINQSEWHRENGLRITVNTLHDGFSNGCMYSVEHARYLADMLNQACEDVETECRNAKQIYFDIGRKLGLWSKTNNRSDQ